MLGRRGMGSDLQSHLHENRHRLSYLRIECKFVSYVSVFVFLCRVLIVRFVYDRLYLSDSQAQSPNPTPDGLDQPPDGVASRQPILMA